ncbi:MAG: MFS transporter [Chloroflexi bacterium]|nr:MFS transporter [Chloroflexota bacterium]
MALPTQLPSARHVTRLSLPLIGAFVVGAIAYGGLYTFPALSVAFAEEFGVSRTVAVTPWTMFLLVTAISSPLLGRAYDEFADRDLLTASMILLAAGWLAMYLAPDISIVILAYAAFHALGLQLAFIGTTTAIARRYAGVSGLALGIAYAGPGIGVAVALPVAAGLIQTAGWRSTSLAFLAASLLGVVFVWLMTAGPRVLVPARPASGTTREKESEFAARASGLHETAAPGAVSAGFDAIIGGGVLLAFGAASDAPALALVGIMAHGVGTGATIAVRSAALSDVFSGPNFGTIFGFMAVAYPVGGAIAVYTGSLSADRFGNYLPLVALVMVALVGWAVALWIAGPRRRGGRSRTSPASSD